jgi:hypothetical protein
MIKSWMSRAVPTTGFAISMMLGFLPGTLSAHAQGSLTAEEWAAAEVGACKVQENHRTRDLDRLKMRLQTSALSREELRFPEKEALDYEKALKKERKVRLHDLEFLLFRHKGKTLEQIFLAQEAATSTMSRQEKASLQRAVHVFADGVTPCLLNALETTLVLADFGLPSAGKCGGRICPRGRERRDTG